MTTIYSTFEETAIKVGWTDKNVRIMPIPFYESNVRTGRVTKWFRPEQIRKSIEEVVSGLTRWNDHMTGSVKFDSHAFLPVDPFGINDFSIVPVRRGVFNHISFSVIKEPHSHKGSWVNFRCAFLNPYSCNKENRHRNQSIYNPHRFYDRPDALQTEPEPPAQAPPVPADDATPGPEDVADDGAEDG